MNCSMNRKLLEIIESEKELFMDTGLFIFHRTGSIFVVLIRSHCTDKDRFDLIALIRTDLISLN